MKVLAGRLTDADRAIIFESHSTGRRVLVATLHANVTYNQHGDTGPQEPMQAVGVAKGWTHDTLTLGSWSFETTIPWESAVGVWWRDEAPTEDQVRALLFEAAA